MSYKIHDTAALYTHVNGDVKMQTIEIVQLRCHTYHRII